MASQSLLSNTIRWLLAWNQLSVALLLVAVMFSATGVVWSAHKTRQLYAELQTLQSKQDNLDSEYEKLLLEQSAWANYARVDQVAREELNMKPPRGDDLVIVRQ